MTLGGTMIAHKAVEYDYCLEIALKSLLSVCDHVVVVVTPERDGTHEIISSLSCPKLMVVEKEWRPSPRGKWLADLTNVAREHLLTPMHLSLQADEVLDEMDYPEIRRLTATGQAYVFHRLNFWHDHRHLLPAEEKVGSHIIRLAPQYVPSGGDAQALDTPYAQHCGARIFHYGFIRDAKKLSAKGRPLVKSINGSDDPLWDDVDKRGSDALVDPKNETAVPVHRLVPYVGHHPRIAHQWLREHGYQL